ncbi:hypothetical protein LXL04_002767 [Taraxacum kok-saghyz]
MLPTGFNRFPPLSAVVKFESTSEARKSQNFFKSLSSEIEARKSQMSIGSTFEGGSRGRRRKVVTCGCGDVCSLAVEGGDCGFFKWYEEEEDGKIYNSQCLKLKKISEQDQMKTLLEVIVWLLVIIMVMLIVVVVKM